MLFRLAHVIILSTLFSCGGDYSSSSRGDVPQTEETGLDIILDRNDVIWGFDFLPDGRIIFTERSGNFFITNLDGTSVMNAGSPPDVSASGEAGLLDVRFFNDQVYYCYSAASGGGRTQALGRATLSGNALINFQKIFDAGGANNSSTHFGCRIEFFNNQILLSVGDQADSSRAQDQNSFQGKILVMNLDGSNPRIFSSGHRNPQGLAFNPATSELFESEHGPVGEDEINIIRAGQNYGWPGESGAGFTDPIISWSPAIAPSGIAFWRGNLYVATLRGRHIRKLVLSGSTVVSEEILFSNEGSRFRNLRTRPGDGLYFSTDDGKLGRIIAQ